MDRAAAPVRPRVRAYHQARTAHLERMADESDVTLLYQKRRYDFHEDIALTLDAREVTVWRAVRALARRNIRTLEVTEPTYLPGVRLAAACILAVRLNQVLGFPRTRVISYAIGNTDPRVDFRPAAARHLPGYFMNRVLAHALWHTIDRVAFGTDAASAAYHEVFRRAPAHQRRRIVPALPSPCACMLSSAPSQAERRGVVFLGALVQRKGFGLLIEAWRSADMRTTLTIIGKGEGETEARNLAASDSRVHVMIDPPRDAVHVALRRASVLVMPSQPSSRWREQVGLPIVEALSHGCTVVTTDETGLADWLASHGHRVIHGRSQSDTLARALRSVALNPLPPSEVLATLPSIDGRAAAQSWLEE